MEILIPISFFAAIAAIFIVPRYFKTKERLAMQDTLRAAYQNGQPISEELIEAISRDAKPTPSPIRDIRGGIIWLALAGGIYGMGYTLSYFAEEAFYGVGAAAAIPAAVGAVLLVMGIVGLATERKPKSKS